MGETTGISWCDHTFNSWWGCVKVDQECKLCYAETFAKRYGFDVFGVNTLRRTFGDKHWAEPVKWNKKAADDGVVRRVFCGSMMDIFEDYPYLAKLQPERHRVYDLIAQTPNLEWLLLTKRPQNIKAMIPTGWWDNPPDNVRIGTTAGYQKSADERIPQLLDGWSGKNFVSVEPMLGPVDLTKIPWGGLRTNILAGPWWTKPEYGVQWVIVGGESGPNCRPMKLEWARDLRDQCAAAGVPYFFKQTGGHPNKGHDPEQWPADLRIQQVPW